MVDTGGRTSRYAHLGQGSRGRGRTRETVNANEDEGLGWRTLQGGSGPPTWRNSSRRAGGNTSRSSAQRPQPIGPGRVPRLIGTTRTQDVGFSPVSRDTYYQDHRHAAGNIMVAARAARGDGGEAVRGYAAMSRRTFAAERIGGRGHQNAGRAGSLEKPASRAWTTWEPKTDATPGEARHDELRACDTTPGRPSLGVAAVTGYQRSGGRGDIVGGYSTNSRSLPRQRWPPGHRRGTGAVVVYRDEHMGRHIASSPSEIEHSTELPSPSATARPRRPTKEGESTVDELIYSVPKSSNNEILVTDGPVTVFPEGDKIPGQPEAWTRAASSGQVGEAFDSGDCSSLAAVFAARGAPTPRPVIEAEATRESTTRPCVDRPEPQRTPSGVRETLLAEGDVADGYERGRRDENMWRIKKALARAEELATKEVEAAQAGAAAERAARAAAEASLADARTSLEETHAQLQESLVNGPLKALEALLDEKAAAEGTAAAAIEAVGTTASKRENARRETSRTVGETEGPSVVTREPEARGSREELELAKLERDKVQKVLVDERKEGDERTREFRAALTKARKEASDCRARAAALNKRLDHTDMSGLQALLASLASENATARSRAAALEAKLEQAASEHRLRSQTFREASIVTAERLSNAEGRAAEAESNVNVAARRLTASECRLRETENSAAEAATAEAAVVAAAWRMQGNASSRSSLKVGVKQDSHGRGRDKGTGGKRGRSAEEYIAPSAAVVKENESATQARPESQEPTAEARGRSAHGATGGCRHDLKDDHHQHPPVVGELENDHYRKVEQGDRRSDGVFGALLRERNDASKGEHYHSFENTGATRLAQDARFGISREAEAATRRVAAAEREAAGLRIDLDRAKAEARQTASEAIRGRERATQESERLARELRVTDNQMGALRIALEEAQKEHTASRKHAESRLEALSLAFEEEMEDSSRVGLAAVLDGGSEIEGRAASLSRASIDARVELKRRLSQAVEAAHEAEVKAKSLRAKLSSRRIQGNGDRTSGVVAVCAVRRAVKNHQCPSAQEALSSTPTTFSTTTATAGVSASHDDSTETVVLAPPVETQATAADSLTVNNAEQLADSPLHVLEREAGNLWEDLACTQARNEGLIEERQQISKAASNVDECLNESPLAARTAAATPQRDEPRSPFANEAASIEEKPDDIAIDPMQKFLRQADFNAGKGRASACLASGAKFDKDGRGLPAGTREAIGGRLAAADEGDAPCTHDEDRCILNLDLDRALKIGLAGTKHRWAAERRADELEISILESERQHALFRGRGESRLEALRLAFVQEQEESGVHTALTTLLEEKSQAEARTAEVERQLAEAIEIAGAAQTESSRLKNELERLVTAKAGDSTATQQAAEPASALVTDQPGACIPASVATTPAVVGARIAEAEAMVTEAEERAATADEALRAANCAALAATEESGLLGRKLERARAAEAMEAEGRQSAQARIAKLEKMIEAAGREQERARERAESRLGALKSAFEQEEQESGGQPALECLLHEKAEAETRVVDLEKRLREAEEAMAAATAGRNVEAAEGNRDSPSRPLSDSENTAVKQDGTESEAVRDVHGNASELAAPTGARQEFILRSAEASAKKVKAEADFLRVELERAQTAQANAMAVEMEEKAVLAKKVSELVEVIEVTRREHGTHREMVESRLETLRSAFEQEEEENGGQDILVVLLEEKAQAEMRATDASRAAEASRIDMEKILKQAEEAVRVAEQRADVLEADLQEQALASKTNATNLKNARVAATEPAGQVKLVGLDAVGALGVDGGAFPRGKIYDLPPRFDTASEAVKTAEARIATVTAEIDRVNADAARRVTAATAEARERADVVVAKAKRVADMESTTARLAAVAAAERAAATEETLRRTETALQGATGDARRLRWELERAKANEEIARAAADKEKGAATGKISQLEGAIQETVREHERSREQAEAQIEALRASLERTHGRGQSVEARSPGNVPSAESAAAAAAAAATQRKRLVETEHQLRMAEEAVSEATKEVERLRDDLARAREAETTSAARREAAERRVADLEGVLEAAELKHVLFREGVEGRLDELKTSIEEEERESGAQVAFAALLAEKSAAERRLAEATRVADGTRSDLERRLIVITDELRAAQERVTTLELELHLANDEGVDHRTATATAEAGSPVGGGGSDDRGTAIDKSTERTPIAARTEHAWQLRVAGKAALVEMATAEAESLRLELSRARDGEAAAAAAAATEERRVAQKRVVELEGAVERAERERESTRKRAEARLEELGRAFDEEERESGVQTALMALLEEKGKTDRRTVETEHRMAQAMATAHAAEARASSLETELENANKAHTTEFFRYGALELRASEMAEAETSKASETIAAAEASLRSVNQSLEDAREEVVLMRGELDLARNRQREAVHAAEGEKRAAREKISELEVVIVKAEEHHLVFRERAEARLERLRLAIEEEEDGSHSALTVLLQEKHQAEIFTDDLTQSTSAIRQELECKLRIAHEALKAAEAKAMNVKAELDHANASLIDGAALAAAEGAVDTIVAAAIATAAERGNTRTAVEKTTSAAAKRIEAAERRVNHLTAAVIAEKTAVERALAERDLAARATQASSLDRMGVAQAEAERLTEEVERARAAEVTATAEVAEARNKISALEAAMEESERTNVLFRERAESRLEVLRQAVEEEELEKGAQSALTVLLQEKCQAETLAADVTQATSDIRRELEEKLRTANEALQVAETRATTLKAEIDDNAASNDGAAQENAERWTQEVEHARAAEATATAEAAEAKNKISALEAAMEESERAHALFRERAESRLEILRQAVEEEELEQGAQGALECLLQEKDQAQARVAELEAQLHRCCQELRAAEAEANAANIGLGQTEGRAAEQLAYGAAGSTTSLGAPNVEMCPLPAGAIVPTSRPTDGCGPRANAAETDEYEALTEFVSSRDQLVKGERDELEGLRTELRVANIELTALKALASAADVRPARPAALDEATIAPDDPRATTVSVAITAPQQPLEEGGADWRSGEAGPTATGLCREQVEARLEVIREAAEEEEAGTQAALAALLDEKCKMEQRVNELEQQLKQALDAVRRAEDRAGPLQERSDGTRGINTATDNCASAAYERSLDKRPTPTEEETVSTQAAAAAASAILAAERRAAAAETALRNTREEVEELEERCALAQARELEAGKAASSRVDELMGELEEATEIGPKAALAALLEENAALAAAAGTTATAIATARSGSFTDEFVHESDAAKTLSLERDKTVELLAKAEARARDLERKLAEAQENASTSVSSAAAAAQATHARRHERLRPEDREIGEEKGGAKADAIKGGYGQETDECGADDSPRSSGSGGDNEESRSSSEEGGTDRGRVVVELLAERDELRRERERLEKEAEEASYVQQEEAYRRTIGVGRYELTLDILTEDLEDAHEKLIKAEAALLQHESDEKLEDRFNVLHQRAKNAEDAKKRADAQLLETKEQLLVACRSFVEAPPILRVRDDASPGVTVTAAAEALEASSGEPISEIADIAEIADPLKQKQEMSPPPGTLHEGERGKEDAVTEGLQIGVACGTGSFKGAEAAVAVKPRPAAPETGNRFGLVASVAAEHDHPVSEIGTEGRDSRVCVDDAWGVEEGSSLVAVKEGPCCNDDSVVGNGNDGIAPDDGAQMEELPSAHVKEAMLVPELEYPRGTRDASDATEGIERDGRDGDRREESLKYEACVAMDHSVEGIDAPDPEGMFHISEPGSNADDCRAHRTRKFDANAGHEQDDTTPGARKADDALHLSLDISPKVNSSGEGVGVPTTSKLQEAGGVAAWEDTTVRTVGEPDRETNEVGWRPNEAGRQEEAGIEHGGPNDCDDVSSGDNKGDTNDGVPSGFEDRATNAQSESTTAAFKPEVPPEATRSPPLAGETPSPGDGSAPSPTRSSRVDKMLKDHTHPSSPRLYAANASTSGELSTACLGGGSEAAPDIQVLRDGERNVGKAVEEEIASSCPPLLPGSHEEASSAEQMRSGDPFVSSETRVDISTASPGHDTAGVPATTTGNPTRARLTSTPSRAEPFADSSATVVTVASPTYSVTVSDDPREENTGGVSMPLPPPELLAPAAESEVVEVTAAENAQGEDPGADFVSGANVGEPIAVSTVENAPGSDGLREQQAPVVERDAFKHGKGSPGLAEEIGRGTTQLPSMSDVLGSDKKPVSGCHRRDFSTWAVNRPPPVVTAIENLPAGAQTIDLPKCVDVYDQIAANEDEAPGAEVGSFLTSSSVPQSPAQQQQSTPFLSRSHSEMKMLAKRETTDRARSGFVGRMGSFGSSWGKKAASPGSPRATVAGKTTTTGSLLEDSGRGGGGGSRSLKSRLPSIRQRKDSPASSDRGAEDGSKLGATSPAVSPGSRTTGGVGERAGSPASSGRNVIGEKGKGSSPRFGLSRLSVRKKGMHFSGNAQDPHAASEESTPSAAAAAAVDGNASADEECRSKHSSPEARGTTAAGATSRAREEGCDQKLPTAISGPSSEGSAASLATTLGAGENPSATIAGTNVKQSLSRGRSSGV